MNKFKLLLLSSVVLFTLSACSQMSRFHTDKQYQDSSAQETAKLRLTTNHSEVFIIPNASCIKVSDNIQNLRKQYMPKRESGGFFSPPPPLKEFNQKSIGMVNIPIEIYKDKFHVNLHSSTYASTEFKLKANEPVVIFIKRLSQISEDIVGVFTKNDGSYSTFGAVFTPVKDREYQVLLEEHWGDKFITYEANFFDITGVKPENINFLVKKAKPCN